jgi:hypothetical protein
MISVDPGVTGTGYAIWKERRLLDVGTLHFRKEQTNWLDRARTVVGLLEHIMASCALTTFVIEYPNFMQGSGGRMVAASGDLVKLSVLTGMMVNVGCRQCRNVRLVSPNEWKGQLPKDVCQSRIIKAMPGMGMEKISNHAYDAIGIGLWAQGRF